MENIALTPDKGVGELAWMPAVLVASEGLALQDCLDFSLGKVLRWPQSGGALGVDYWIL